MCAAGQRPVPQRQVQSKGVGLTLPADADVSMIGGAIEGLLAPDAAERTAAKGMARIFEGYGGADAAVDALENLVPHRCAPCIDGVVPLRSGAGTDDVLHRNYPALTRKRPLGPLPLPLGELHVRQLHTATRAPLLLVQIQADQRGRQRDRLCAFVGLLCRECVYDVLVYECRIAMHERVGAQLVVMPHVNAVEKWNHRPTESVRERLAEALGVEPVEIRLRAAQRRAVRVRTGP